MPLPKRISPRWNKYDYTSAGGYFVTICTKNREHYFGEIVDGKMILNELGRFATDHWKQVSDHYPFVEMHEFICMPNHIHGILIIGQRGVGTQLFASATWLISETNGNERTYKNTSLREQIQPASWSLGAIIRGYKIWITKFATQNNIPFARQSRYHDHVIRTAPEYERITNYIQTNPANWDQDIFYI